MLQGFPHGTSGKLSACQYRRHKKHGFNHWMGRPLEEEMQPTPIFLPEKFSGQRSLVGYSLWDHKELDMTD